MSLSKEKKIENKFLIVRSDSLRSKPKNIFGIKQGNTDTDDEISALTQDNDF